MGQPAHRGDEEGYRAPPSADRSGSDAVRCRRGKAPQRKPVEAPREQIERLSRRRFTRPASPRSARTSKPPESGDAHHVTTAHDDAG
jgi:hypothetical protein